MANTNRPAGFVPVRTGSGAPWNGQANVYHVPSTDTSAMYIGDTVKSVASGDATGIPDVQKCATNDNPRGVIVGFYVTPPTAPASLAGAALSLENTYIPATKTKDYYVMVVDDPFAVFEIQDNGGSALTNTSVNKNAGYTMAVPTAPVQVSATTMTTSTVATTSTLPIRLLGLAQRPDNAFGVYAKWLCMFNNHELRGPTAGV